MPLLQIGWAVISRPDSSLGILPDQNLKWKVDSATGRRQHDWSARFWISENQQVGRRHFQPRFSCFSAVIDYRKQSDALCLKHPFHFLDRLVHRVIARYINKSAAFIGRHKNLRTELQSV